MPRMYGPDDTMQPDAGNSAALLMKLFGQGGGGADSLQLRSLQDQRLGELNDQIANESSAPDIQARSSNGGTSMIHDPVSAASILRKGLLKKQLEQDMASDPDMGDAALNRVHQVDTQNQEAADYQDPQQTAMRQSMLRDKMAPDVLKFQSEQMKEQNAMKQATDVAHINAQGRIDAASAKNTQTIGPDGQPINTKPFGATENRGLEALTNGAHLVDLLEPTLHPEKNQLMDWLEKQGQYALYKAGISASPVSQERMNLAGLLRVMGAAPYVAGSRHFAFMQQAQEHLTNPAATDAFLATQVKELKRIWPELAQGIIQVHDNPRKPITFASQTAGDPYADPNYQPK